MPLTIDEYRTSWAIRYIREAEADLSAAEKMPMPAESIGLSLLAMKKSQTAVYYSLGDPQYLTPLILRTIAEERKANDALMRTLIQFELSIERNGVQAEKLGKTAMIEEAQHLLEIATKIVCLMTGKPAGNSA